MQPTLGLLWTEAIGRLSYRDTWMYVIDGGHYDSLGLVEALRPGAQHIVVLDASGDKADNGSRLVAPSPYSIRPAEHLGISVSLKRRISQRPVTQQLPPRRSLARRQAVLSLASAPVPRSQDLPGT
jgi:hypothetical protein